MITKKTVLILGAGASNEFGFPLGEDLKSNIIQSLSSPDNKDFQQLEEFGFDRNHIIKFKKSLSRSPGYSIDAFLEYRPDFHDIGKAVIAQSLIKYEDLGKMFDVKDNWYKYLYKRLKSPFEEFGNNQLSVITFNYDRSFEQYMFTALENDYDKKIDEVAEKVGTVPVVHVYGKLAPLPWQCGIDKSAARVFKSDLNFASIKRGSNGIKIIHESSNPIKAQGLMKAKELLNKTELIVFLGFGYDSINLKRLFSGVDLSMKELCGSCFKFTKLEKITLRDDVFRTEYNRDIFLGSDKDKVLDFLRNTVSFE